MSGVTLSPVSNTNPNKPRNCMLKKSLTHLHVLWSFSSTLPHNCCAWNANGFSYLQLSLSFTVWGYFELIICSWSVSHPTPFKYFHWSSISYLPSRIVVLMCEAFGRINMAVMLNNFNCPLRIHQTIYLVMAPHLMWQVDTHLHSKLCWPHTKR